MLSKQIKLGQKSAFSRQKSAERRKKKEEDSSLLKREEALDFVL